MEHKAFFKNKARNKPVTSHSDTKRNIPRGLIFAIIRIFCIALIPLTNELNGADCGYKVHGNEKNKSLILYG